MSRDTQGQIRSKRSLNTEPFFDIGYHTAPGRQRNHNEDACALPGPDADQARYGTLLVLADGVGGLPGGAAASQQAVQDLQALYYLGYGPSEVADRLRYCVESINAINRFHTNKHDQINAYLTTLVAAVIVDDQIWIANVGDSRAYLIQQHSSRRLKLTEDHSRETQLAKRGVMDDKGMLHNQGVITRAIGLEERCQVDTYHYTWNPGDRLILCSDGLTQLPEQEMITLTLGQPAKVAARQLVDRAIQLDGSDNCTVVVAASNATYLSQSKSILKPFLNSNRAASTPLHQQPRMLILFGLLLGWLSAALLAAYWLEANGIIDIFK